MMDFMEFYVSDFWVWAGITVGVGLIVQGAILMVAVITAVIYKRRAINIGGSPSPSVLKALREHRAVLVDPENHEPYGPQNHPVTK